MQIEGLISIALTFVLAFAMKTTGKKMVHSSYPTQKMFAEGRNRK
jgi:hypothetical protein